MNSMAKQESHDESPMKLVSIPDGLGPDDDRSDVGELSVSILSTMPAMLERLIEDIHLNGGNKITCIVADVIMGWALEVGSKLGIKGVLFWTASATMFALQYNIPTLIQDGIIDSDGKCITFHKSISPKKNISLVNYMFSLPIFTNRKNITSQIVNMLCWLAFTITTLKVIYSMILIS